MAFVNCPKCKAALPSHRYNREELLPCHVCSSRTLAAVFPALLQAAPQPLRGELAVDDAQSTCFYHPRKKAAAICDHCGRFLCSLCDVPAGNSHYCPNCLGRSQDTPREMQTRCPLHDTLAVVLAIIPLGITPLIAIYLAIRHWGEQTPLMPRGRVRWYLACLLAAAQLAAWVLVCTGRWP